MVVDTGSEKIRNAPMIGEIRGKIKKQEKYN